MNRITYFLAGLILGGFGVFLALKYHIVRAEDGVHVIPKAEATLQDIYADIRRFDFQDWKEHAALAAAITKAEKSELMRPSAANTLRNTVDGLLPGNNP